MLTKAQIKYIRSLTQQKFRNEYKAFIAEGEKIATEWLSSCSNVRMIVATEDWAARHTALLQRHSNIEQHIVPAHVLVSVSALQTPGEVLLVVSMPAQTVIPIVNDWYIALDTIQDPGNIGTIIRIADWFGIRNIICSPGCADVYSPKVVQSAMGSHLRVNIFESELLSFFETAKLPVIAATLHGEPVYGIKRMNAGILVIGNESKGISEPVLAKATQKVTIPRRGGAESLNAGVSAGILCALLLPC